MGNFLSNITSSFFNIESKSIGSATSVPVRSADDIRKDIRDQDEGLTTFGVSVVHACARVIAEGLAIPPCYIHKAGPQGRALATDHPLYDLLNLAPNVNQTSYQLREWIGWHLALNGNAFVYISRRRDGSILELIPIDDGFISYSEDLSQIGSEVSYFVGGKLVPRSNIWHLKGPSWNSWEGMRIVEVAQKSIRLAHNMEKFGAKLFENGARPAGMISQAAGSDPLTVDQMKMLKEQFKASVEGIRNAHSTLFLPAGLTFTAMAATANEAQFIEARAMQVEEICRYFRVSPIKVMRMSKSFSYASVEQAHLSHNADTDAHWLRRFTESATVNLLTPAERKAGYTVSLDDRSIRQGSTAGERMAYYTAGIAAKMFTPNECRVMEGLDPLADPEADKLASATSLLPKTPDAASTDEEPKNGG